MFFFTQELLVWSSHWHWHAFPKEQLRCGDNSVNFLGGKHGIKKVGFVGGEGRLTKITALFFRSFILLKICFVSLLFRFITVAHFIFLVAHCSISVQVSLFGLFRVVCTTKGEDSEER